MILQATDELTYVPKRIVSLVPSQTELLHYLGLNEQTVGITKFCMHPNEWFRSKTRIGGTKNVHTVIIDGLQPDLIIANKEENVKEQVEELAKHYPVWVTDVNNVEDALQMIKDIGALTGIVTAAARLIVEIEKNFAGVELKNKNEKIDTAYLIWRDPYMTVGGDTFINDMLTRCGLHNVFARNTRYPVISVDQLQTANCKLLLLSSEPYPFKQQHIDELQVQLPGTKIMLVDGEIFSWYGSRLLLAAAYFKELMDGVLPERK